MHLTYRMRVFRIISFGALGEAVMGLDMNELAFHLLLQRAMLVAVLWHTSSSLPKLFI